MIKLIVMFDPPYLIVLNPADERQAFLYDAKF